MSYKMPDAADKAVYVQSKFDEIAPKYDIFNDLITFGMHRYWKRFVARQTGLVSGGRVLDLCTGTGDLAQCLRRDIPGCDVVAADFSIGMLKVARSRSFSQGPLPVMQGDAMQLPFADETFDVVTCCNSFHRAGDAQGFGSPGDGEREHPAETIHLPGGDRVVGVVGQPGIEHPRGGRMLRQTTGQHPRPPAVGLHPHRESPHPPVK